MGLHFEFDPNKPLQVIDDIIPQIELLADCLGFSGDHFTLSEHSLTALTDTFNAISRALKQVSEAESKRPTLRAV